MVGGDRSGASGGGASAGGGATKEGEVRRRAGSRARMAAGGPASGQACGAGEAANWGPAGTRGTPWFIADGGGDFVRPDRTCPATRRWGELVLGVK